MAFVAKKRQPILKIDSIDSRRNQHDKELLCQASCSEVEEVVVTATSKQHSL